MTKIISNENELSKALKFLQNYINNKSEFQIKAIKALEIYENIKKNQIKYQESNKDKVKIITKRYYDEKYLILNSCKKS